MSAKFYGVCVRIAVICMALCGIVLSVWILYGFRHEIFSEHRKIAFLFRAWLLLVWTTALPCLGVLALEWKVAGAISRNETFTLRVAKWMKTAAMLIFVSVGIFFIGNLLFLCMNLTHPWILIASLLVDMVGVALAGIAASIGKYVEKKAMHKEGIGEL
ncbi:MAG: DUF2975 domain-containing protein [Oscillospiraceae bacterium]|nr:DUF2975 domain-containing protein [Oscillospiraceae bacterium]